MNIVWVLSSANVREVRGEVTSPLASYRYRVAIPMRELRSRGHTCSWIGIGGAGADRDTAALRNADVVVFSKIHDAQEHALSLLRETRASGTRTLADVCDDYFEPGARFADYYRALVTEADQVTSSSRQLSEYVEEATGRGSHVVPDPFEGPGGNPRWRTTMGTVKALWFGGSGNMRSLVQEAESLPARMSGFSAAVVVLTAPLPGIEDAFQRFNRVNGEKLTLHFREWSLERNWSELERCDLVMIPVEPRERFYRAKGPNRLIEALWAGRFAVVNSIPAYDEFAQWAWVGDIAQGIAWAIAHPDDVTRRIAAAREYIAERYAPAAVAAEWERALIAGG